MATPLRPPQSRPERSTSLPAQGLTAASIKAADSEEKNVDDLVLSELYYDIARNLPPDDVLSYMYQDNLITDGQRDHYKMMKANNQPEMERSEYLLDCLRKGEPGFLRKLCTILRNIPPASYLADNIEEKRMQLDKEQSTVRTPARTDRTKKTRGDTSHWLTEYKRLEQKTRRQLHAKDKEIKRLRNVIVQLESENYENLKQLLKDMKYQVDLVSKWIDHKSGTLTTESALVRMALSRHGKVDDIFSGSSESSSNQSTLDRPQKSQNRRRDRGAMLCHSPLNMPLSESTVKDDTKQETSPLIEGGSHDYAVTALQHFTVNVSNPPTAADSDTSDITRPLQATQAVVTVPTAPTSEFGITGAYLSQLMQQDHREESSVSPNDALAFYDITSTLLDVQPASVTEPTHDTVTNMVAAAASKDAVAVRTSDGSHTPSTVKSTAGTPNTISPTPSSQDGSKTPYSSKTFLYGRALSPRSYHQSDESSTDFKAVFRKIRGRDPPTK